MNKRYLAYIALLAGWLCFCYWLYAKGIYPRLHGGQEKFWPSYTADLPYPLAYRWASDTPLSGAGFGELRTRFLKLDSTDAMVIVHGFYFRDEADSLAALEKLGWNRVVNALKYIQIDDKRMVTQVKSQEVNGDVRSKPFEAVRFERIPFSDIVKVNADTFEICFPFKDSMNLPPDYFNRLNSWITGQGKKNEKLMHIVGTADATGIVESAEQGLERAMTIKNKLVANGWRDEQIVLSTGQRSQPLTLRNRCVVIYFE